MIFPVKNVLNQISIRHGASDRSVCAPLAEWLSATVTVHGIYFFGIISMVTDNFSIQSVLILENT